MPPIVSTVLWIAFAVLVLFATVQIVPQAKAYVVERLGAYKATWSVGIHFKIPVIDRVAKKGVQQLLKPTVHNFNIRLHVFSPFSQLPPGQTLPW